MKKNILLLSMIAFSSSLFAQVGVNTPNPKSTFDINAKNTIGTSNNVDGLLIPRVDRQRAQSMSNIEISTLVYINNIATGSRTGSAINIDEIGYYMFNGTTWIKLNTNIYNTNGTLSGNRIVSQGINTLAFTSSATTGTNHFSVDGSTLSIDANNNRVGIGTTTPKNQLDLGSGNGKKLALWNSTAGDDFYGLGNAPEVLQLFAGAKPTDDEVMTIKKNGNVGIGNTSPNAKLDIKSSSSGAVKIVDGTEKNGYVLTSDNNGVGTWQQIAATFGTVNVTANDYTLQANTPNCKYVGVPITLPPGKWLLSLNIGIEHQINDTSSKESTFMRFRLGDSKNDMADNAFSNDAISPRMASQGFFRAIDKGMIVGNLGVNNTSGSPKTYYLFIDNAGGYKTEVTIRLGWNETSITYQKIQ